MLPEVNSIPEVDLVKASYEEYAQVCHMNNVMGNPAGCAIGNPAKWRSQLRNVVDEVEELQVAVKSGNAVDELDALCDIKVFILGAYHIVNAPISMATLDGIALLAGDELAFDADFLVGKLLPKFTENMRELIDASTHDMEEDDILATLREFSLPQILTVVAIIARAKKYDIHGAMAEVYRSNMSKLCADADVLQASEEKFKALGVPYYVEGEFPEVRLKASEDCKDSEGNAYRKGKFLKSTSYSPPNLTAFVTAFDA